MRHTQRILLAAGAMLLAGVPPAAAAPANPVLVGHTPFNAAPLNPPPIEGIDGPYHMTVAGNYAYVANERRGSFAVIDIADPTNPTFVTESPRPGLSNARSVVVEGSYAYVADFVENAFSIFDVSNPAAPSFVSKVEDDTLLDGASSIAIAGDYAYVAVAGKSSPGYVGGDRLTIIDIANKSQPVVAGSTQGPVPGSSLDRVRDIDVEGSYAYLASTGPGGLAVVDISDPANPTWTASVACPGGTTKGVQGVKVVATYAYIACSANQGVFGVVDISNPAAPVVAGWTKGPEPGETFLAAFHLDVSGSHAFVTLSQFAMPGGKVVVVDISDPANPTVVGQTTEVREARAIGVVGDYLFTASDAWDAFMAFDIGPNPPPPPPPPPTCTLIANPPAIGLGQSATLSWESVGAVSGTFLAPFGVTHPMDPVAAGSTTVKPSRVGTATYTGSVVDGTGGQPSTCTAAITVTEEPPPAIAIKDVKTEGASNDADVQLDTMGLEVAPGDLIVILAYARYNRGSGPIQITQGDATGWSEIAFEARPGGNNAHAVRGLWKVADGSEDVVDALNWSNTGGGANARHHLYYAFSYGLTGAPTFGGGTAEATEGDPAPQTIAAAGAPAPVLAFSLAGSQSTTPDQTFVAETPDQNIAASAGGNVLQARVKTRLFTSPPQDIVSDLADIGNRNGLLTGYLKVQ